MDKKYIIELDVHILPEYEKFISGTDEVILSEIKEIITEAMPTEGLTYEINGYVGENK